MTNRTIKEIDANRDPISGAPGSHPLGTGAGAAAGGIAGAAAGTIIGGPIGTVVGAAIGAVAGGLAGKGAAESVNPTDPAYTGDVIDGTVTFDDSADAPTSLAAGAGTGAAAGAVAGASVGAVAGGPIGAIVGGVGGAVAGGAAGKGVAEAVNPKDGTYGVDHGNGANGGFRNDSVRTTGRDGNRDSLTGEPGSHPVGTGAGAPAGGMAGAAAGSLAGPIGTVVGAAAGAVAGGALGKGAAELIDPTAEDAYWRENYSTEPYYSATKSYDDYAPAYRAGYEGRARYFDRAFEDAERDLAGDYARMQRGGSAGWGDMRDAVHAAWDRADQSIANAKKRIN